ncbi:MAG: hypothetical protein ACI9YO_002934 [Gammaproteobacteria bacterium]|jgi:hypothetical protein
MNNKPIIVGLCGGLGNQLFQYAAGRALSLKLGVPVELDHSWFAGSKDRSYTLSEFKINATPCIGLPIISKKIKALESKVSRKYFSQRMGVPIFRETSFNFMREFEEISQPVFLQGYWQSEKYFDRFSEQIRKELTFSNSVPKKCNALMESISKTQSICIHIRRGDYISNSKTRKIFHACSLDYYKENVNRLCKNLTNPHCFVFSDDCEWARSNIKLNIPYTIVDINEANEAHLDLLLMSLCNDFVIANSSFSWWGAWLGSFKNKRIVAPKNWFIRHDINTDDLIPSNWERR